MKMDQHVQISYIGLVRNVIGCSEEKLTVIQGTTVGELLRLLTDKHGRPFRESVFKSSGELRSMAQVCVEDRDIEELQGFDTALDGGKVSILVGVYPPEGG
jgi:molybdopterin converting factor small subunit